MANRAATTVIIEAGQRRAFASAVDWPGWCRAGKTEEAALEALATYAPRYAVVTDEAGVAFGVGSAPRFEVVERVAGNATTDFGAPGVVAEVDGEPLTRARAAKHAAILGASWVVLDRVVAGAPPVLRKGPRGGGRDRDAIVDHVIEAEISYARTIGLRGKRPDPADGAAVAASRAEIVALLGRASDGAPLIERGWPPRYATRRMAWHVLDHAWEIEDRSDLA